MDVSVDLDFERPRLLSGTAGGQPVSLELDGPSGYRTARGTFGPAAVSVSWELGDNYYIYPDVPASLTGEFGGQSVELHGTFHLEPGYFFHHGAVTGHVGAQTLDVAVKSAGQAGTRTIAADGKLGGTGFTLYASVDGPLESALIGGTVAGQPVRIEAARTSQPGGTLTRLTGSFAGPPELLALAAGALLHFI